jgi:hypothetical protein
MSSRQMRGRGTTKPVAKDVARGTARKAGNSSSVTVSGVTMALGALLLAAIVPLGLNPLSRLATARTVPGQAQVIDQKAFVVLDTVPPPLEANATTVCLTSLNPGYRATVSRIDYRGKSNLLTNNSDFRLARCY